MNAQELKASLTVEDIIHFVIEALGSEDYREDNAGNPIFQTIDHNGRGQGKYKLYYYPDTQIFISYTAASKPMDIYSLVQEAGYASDFKGAFHFVANFFGYDIYSEDFIKPEEVELTSDWDLLNKIAALECKEEKPLRTKILSSSLIEYFPHLLPAKWTEEGISSNAMEKFNIRMDTVNQKIVIPHYNVDGQLIGLRGRSFNWFDLERGAKYSPLYLGINTIYNHPLGEHLYGLWVNKETIRATKTVVIAESEKSVLFAETYYPNHNFTVAVCGSSITDVQVQLLLSLGVTQVILALDKENTDCFDGETLEYRDKLLQMAYKFTPYASTYILMDHEGLLEPKDSPFDKGKEILERMMEHKEQVLCLNTLQQKGRKKK